MQKYLQIFWRKKSTNYGCIDFFYKEYDKLIFRS
jgi:hypothetical protein